MAVVIFFIAMFHCQIVASAGVGNVGAGANNSDSLNYIAAAAGAAAFAGGDGVGGHGATVAGYYDDASSSRAARNDVYSSSSSRLRRSPIYHNEFAVYIPSGIEAADSIADKHGFANGGQVSYRFAILL